VKLRGSSVRDIRVLSWPSHKSMILMAYADQEPIVVANLTHSWPAEHWVSQDQPDEALPTHIKMARVAVRTAMRYASDMRPVMAPENPFSKFFHRWAQSEAGTNNYLTLDQCGSHDDCQFLRHAFTAGYSRPDFIAEDSLMNTCQDQSLTYVLSSSVKGNPPQAWVLVSVEGSGSGWHIDPWNTSAWNSLIKGRKRWALYPPHSRPPPHAIGAKPIDFFSTIMPALPADEKPPYDFVMEAGDTVFIPSGWWHTVLNLSPTVAVTENRMDLVNAHEVMTEMRQFMETGANSKFPKGKAPATSEQHLSGIKQCVENLSKNYGDLFREGGDRFI